MLELVNELKTHIASIKQAIKEKQQEIDPNKEWGDIDNNFSNYPNYVKELDEKFSNYFTKIGYGGLPIELRDTLKNQILYNETKNASKLGTSLFIGTNFEGNLSNNYYCIILYTDSYNSTGTAFQWLLNLKELRLKPGVEGTKIKLTGFCRDTKQLEIIEGYLDVSDYGYYLNSEGNYFFSGYLRDGNSTTPAYVPKLHTIKLKGIKRAYDFSLSPLSMESVLYCINNALYNQEYVDNGENNYKFTLKNSAYTEEQKAEIINAVATKAAALGGNGLNMDIVFA